MSHGTPPAPPPLQGLRVLELAGLAPAPFAGMLLADYGATVLRIDRPSTSTQPPPDQLTRHKSSLALDLKSPRGRTLFLHLLRHADVLLDPYRPGVLEALGLGPSTLLAANPSLIFTRLTGFRREGPEARMAGHDVNYLAAAGVLSSFGPRAQEPAVPGNVVADFGGGGLVAVLGVLLALVHRERSLRAWERERMEGGDGDREDREGWKGEGQVVEVNMVDGAAALGSMARLGIARGKRGIWGEERGANILDGGAPWYGVYRVKDGGFVAVGALEDQFFTALLAGLQIPSSALPGPRSDRTSWPALRAPFARTFLTKTRDEWEAVFTGTDACVTPVRTFAELKEQGWEQRLPAVLRRSPGLAVAQGKEGRSAETGQGMGVVGSGWEDEGLVVGSGGVEVLREWCGWEVGKEVGLVDGGMIWLGSDAETRSEKAKL